MHQRQVLKNCSTCKQTKDNKYLFGTRKHSNRINQREENEYDCHHHRNRQNINPNNKNESDDYQYPRNRTNYGYSNKSQDYQFDERIQNNRVWNGSGRNRRHNLHQNTNHNSYENPYQNSHVNSNGYGNQHNDQDKYSFHQSQDEDDEFGKEDNCNKKESLDYNGGRRKGCGHRKCKNVDVELENTSCPPNHFLGNPNIATNYISSVWNRRMSMYPWGYPSPYAPPLY